LPKSLPSISDEDTRLKGLNRFLFEENGFFGSRAEYYHEANSYVNDVLDDREGLPITLSIIYIELAKRIGLKPASKREVRNGALDARWCEVPIRDQAVARDRD